MDKENLKGKLDQAGGKVKEEFGEATGNRSLENEGKTDQAKGKVRDAVGDLKDSVRDTFRDHDDKDRGAA